MISLECQLYRAIQLVHHLYPLTMNMEKNKLPFIHWVSQR
jgi:hypothetical protein